MEDFTMKNIYALVLLCSIGLQIKGLDEACEQLTDSTPPAQALWHMWWEPERMSADDIRPRNSLAQAFSNVPYFDFMIRVTEKIPHKRLLNVFWFFFLNDGRMRLEHLVTGNSTYVHSPVIEFRDPVFYNIAGAHIAHDSTTPNGKVVNRTIDTCPHQVRTWDPYRDMYIQARDKAHSIIEPEESICRELTEQLYKGPHMIPREQVEANTKDTNWVSDFDPYKLP
jgi:hypothetical protein